jgi:flagellar assembly factor FliW
MRVSSRSGAGAAQEDPAGPANVGEIEFFFPAGLLGFPASRRFKLEKLNAGEGAESPFLLLSAVGQDLSFPLIHPETVGLDYQVPVSPELLRALGAQSSDELVTLLIVTVRDRVEQTTLNLQGPLIVSLRSGRGMQLVLESYPLRHPLFKSASETS